MPPKKAKAKKAANAAAKPPQDKPPTGPAEAAPTTVSISPTPSPASLSPRPSGVGDEAGFGEIERMDGALSVPAQGRLAGAIGRATGAQGQHRASTHRLSTHRLSTQRGSKAGFMGTVSRLVGREGTDAETILRDDIARLRQENEALRGEAQERQVQCEKLKELNRHKENSLALSLAKGHIESKKFSTRLMEMQADIRAIKSEMKKQELLIQQKDRAYTSLQESVELKSRTILVRHIRKVRQLIKDGKGDVRTVIETLQKIEAGELDAVFQLSGETKGADLDEEDRELQVFSLNQVINDQRDEINQLTLKHKLTQDLLEESKAREAQLAHDLQGTIQATCLHPFRSEARQLREEMRELAEVVVEMLQGDYLSEFGAFMEEELAEREAAIRGEYEELLVAHKEEMKILATRLNFTESRMRAVVKGVSSVSTDLIAAFDKLPSFEPEELEMHECELPQPFAKHKLDDFGNSVTPSVAPLTFEALTAQEDSQSNRSGMTGRSNSNPPSEGGTPRPSHISLDDDDGVSRDDDAFSRGRTESRASKMSRVESAASVAVSNKPADDDGLTPEDIRCFAAQRDAIQKLPPFFKMIGELRELAMKAQEYKRRMEEAEAKLAIAEARIEELEGELEAAKQRIVVLEERVAQLETELAAQVEENERLRKIIEELEAEIKRLEREVIEVAERVRAAAAAEIEALKSVIENQENQIENMKVQHQKDMQEAREHIDMLQTQIQNELAAAETLQEQAQANLEVSLAPPDGDLESFSDRIIGFLEKGFRQFKLRDKANHEVFGVLLRRIEKMIIIWGKKIGMEFGPRVPEIRSRGVQVQTLLPVSNQEVGTVLVTIAVLVYIRAYTTPPIPYRWKQRYEEMQQLPKEEIEKLCRLLKLENRQARAISSTTLAFTSFAKLEVLKQYLVDAGEVQPNCGEKVDDHTESRLCRRGLKYCMSTPPTVITTADGPGVVPNQQCGQPMPSTVAPRVGTMNASRTSTPSLPRVRDASGAFNATLGSMDCSDVADVVPAIPAPMPSGPAGFTGDPPRPMSPSADDARSPRGQTPGGGTSKFPHWRSYSFLGDTYSKPNVSAPTRENIIAHQACTVPQIIHHAFAQHGAAGAAVHEMPCSVGELAGLSPARFAASAAIARASMDDAEREPAGALSADLPRGTAAERGDSTGGTALAGMEMTGRRATKSRCNSVGAPVAKPSSGGERPNRIRVCCEEARSATHGHRRLGIPADPSGDSVATPSGRGGTQAARVVHLEPPTPSAMSSASDLEAIATYNSRPHQLPILGHDSLNPASPKRQKLGGAKGVFSLCQPLDAVSPGTVASKTAGTAKARGVPHGKRWDMPLDMLPEQHEAPAIS